MGMPCEKHKSPRCPGIRSGRFWTYLEFSAKPRAVSQAQQFWPLSPESLRAQRLSPGFVIRIPIHLRVHIRRHPPDEGGFPTQTHIRDPDSHSPSTDSSVSSPCKRWTLPCIQEYKLAVVGSLFWARCFTYFISFNFGRNLAEWVLYSPYNDEEPIKIQSGKVTPPDHKLAHGMSPQAPSLLRAPSALTTRQV